MENKHIKSFNEAISKVKEKWYVYDLDHGGEISINFGDPKKHFRSYGWDGDDKIIISKNDRDEEDKEDEDSETYLDDKNLYESKHRKMLERANVIATALNNLEK